MSVRGAALREIAIPATAFGTLRAQLEKEAGSLPTVHALHHAGYTAGAAAAPSVGGDAGALGEDAFWAKLADFFGKRGWGALRHTRPHPAVGLLSSTDWAEATAGDGGPEASCHFSAGFLSGLLTELAGGPVAVLEVACRSRGSDACQFLFGSEGAIHELYGRLLEDDNLDGALSAL